MPKRYGKTKLYTPTADEERRLCDVDAGIRELLQALPCVRGVEAVGSFSRGTMIRGHRELDYYVQVTSEQEFFTSLQPAPLKHRNKGLRYVTLTRTCDNRDYLVDLVPYVSVTQERALAHRDFLLPRLTDAMRKQIRWSKFILKRVGLYNADQRYRGFSGWAIEALVYLYGSLAKIPRVQVIPCPVNSERNLLGSVSPENLERFFTMRERGWKRRVTRQKPPLLFRAQPLIKLGRNPFVRRLVPLRNYTLVELQELARAARVIPTCDSYYDETRGRLYYGIPGLKVFSPEDVITSYGLVPIAPDDFTNIRIYNYFK